MKLYLAPIQGFTDWIFREAYSKIFGNIDKYFSPYIRIQEGEFYQPNRQKDIFPEYNKFQKPIPQFLGNDIKSFKIFEELCGKFNYHEVNINMGCPFSKITNRGLGAGLLINHLETQKLLDEIFTTSKLNISVKCRIGIDNTDEFLKIINILNNYPLVEIIIHPRFASQLYKGDIKYDDFKKIVPEIKHNLCYNGDIFNNKDIERIQKDFPEIDRFMIGRGILTNPFLVYQIFGKELSDSDKRAKMLDFQVFMIELCKEKYSGDISVIKRFEELWEYQSLIFENGRKIYKHVKKSKSINEYLSVIEKAISSSEFLI